MNVSSTQLRQLEKLIPEVNQKRFREIFAGAFTYKNVTRECVFETVAFGDTASTTISHHGHTFARVGMNTVPIMIEYANNGVYKIEADVQGYFKIGFCPD
jgi:hypothetical protein